jgi:hypothetical protein
MRERPRARPRAGGGGPGDDAAALLGASWRAARRGVLARAGLQQFHFRQFLFACQARLLLQQRRPVEVRARRRRPPRRPAPARPAACAAPRRPPRMQPCIRSRQL